MPHGCYDLCSDFLYLLTRPAAARARARSPIAVWGKRTHTRHHDGQGKTAGIVCKTVIEAYRINSDIRTLAYYTDAAARSRSRTDFICMTWTSQHVTNETSSITWPSRERHTPSCRERTVPASFRFWHALSTKRETFPSGCTLGSRPWALVSLRNEGSPTSSPGRLRRVSTRLKVLQVSGRDRHVRATRSVMHEPATPITARHTHACLSLRRGQIASRRSRRPSEFCAWLCGSVCAQNRVPRSRRQLRPTSTTRRPSSRSTWATRSSCTTPSCTR
jgi:hypothetical protein